MHSGGMHALSIRTHELEFFCARRGTTPEHQAGAGRGEGTLILAGSQIAPRAGPRAVGRRRQQQGWRSNLAACFHSTPPTPTPTQTSHWGRQITAQPPVSRAGSNLGDVAPWGGGCRSLRGPKVVKHVLQTLNISLTRICPAPLTFCR